MSGVVVDRCETFRKELDAARARGHGERPASTRLSAARAAARRTRSVTVGLVPTMGALHEGHVSLIERSVTECDVTAVTVFVNQLQFDSAHDLAAYPTDLEADLATAAGAGADLVFAPSAAEMWPDGPPRTVVTVAGLSGRLEGASRPGHFDGVATVVARLFNLAGHCRAYFGEKDFQQLAVVKSLAHDLAFPVQIVPCPTVRQPDGLALSSRNALLSGTDLVVARVLSRAMLRARAEFAAGVDDAASLRQSMHDVFAGEPAAELDYAEVVDPHTLTPMSGKVDQNARLVVAGVIGGTRLIDNMAVHDEEM